MGDLALSDVVDDVRKVRERILNVVGHELLTPVSTVRGLAEAIADGDAATRERLAPLLRRNARRLERLVNDLLLAAGVETVLPVGAADEVNVVDAVRLAWGGAEEPGLELDVDPQATAAMEPRAFRRSLEHILDNAKVYGRLPVTVTARRRGPDVEITVDSPGEALHPEEVRLAAEPFYRGERAVMTAPGLGLGLAVARALVQHAGGHLSVSARPDGGLVTRVVLSAEAAS